MRKLLAAVLAGIVVWMWGAVFHMLTPFGTVDFKNEVAGEQAVMAAMKAEFTQGDGIYILPSMNLVDHGDEAAAKAWAEKAKTGPYAWVVYKANGLPGDPAAMGPQILHQLLTSTIAAFLLAVVLGAVPGSYAKRVGVATVIGLFAWLSISVPQFTWYYFPRNFAFVGALEHGVGALLAGLILAKLVKPAAG